MKENIGISEEIENEFEIKKWWELKIDKNYEYIPKNELFRLASNVLYYGIAFPILIFLIKIIYQLEIEGKQYLEELKGAAITVSNHVLVLDCAMVGIACMDKKVFFTTQEESFQIPFVRKLVRLFGALPIPKKLENKKYFIKAVNQLLKEEQLVHFYPEGELVPYNDQIGTFRSGAFEFAVKNNVPIVPMVFTFRNPKGIRKLWKRKKDVTLSILEPISPKEENKNLTKEELKQKVALKMKEKLNGTSE